MAFEHRRRGTLLERSRRSGLARHVLVPRTELLRGASKRTWPLFAMTILALLFANSTWIPGWNEIWQSKIRIDLGFGSIEHDARRMLNDLLLPVFFFLVGVELKHELVCGELASWKRAALPLATALGGVIVPAALYALLNLSGGSLRGWAIPIATDVAFALAVLSLLGSKVPPALQVLVLAFAVIDDIIGVAIIAVFYSSHFAPLPFGIACAGLLLIIALQRTGVRAPELQVLLGLVVLVATWFSGVHTTIAGAALGLAVNARPRLGRNELVERGGPLLDTIRSADERLQNADDDESENEAREEQEEALGRLEELVVSTESTAARAVLRVSPWVNYAVLPAFALANAGIEISGESLSTAMQSPVAWGVLVGLVLGKPAGILLGAAVTRRLGLAELPEGVRFSHLAIMGFVAGIGFTVSLFLNTLAFGEGSGPAASGRLAVLFASVLAGLLGYVAALLLLGRQSNEA